MEDDAPLAGARDFLARYRSPDFQAELATMAGPRHLDPDFELVQDSFRAFADKEITPVAEHVHRTNGDVPESIIAGLADMGAFGLSVPAEYGGWSEGGDSEYLGMVVATEELSRGSLGIGGSSSRARRSSPAPSCAAGPRSRSRSGCRSWRRERSWPRWP